MKKEKTFKDYIHVSIWFAWFPVKTDNGWVWLRYVKRTVDECPEVYLGLLPERSYAMIKSRG